MANSIKTIKTIEYRWFEEPDGETYTADVVVGSTGEEWEDDYPFDERIFFYFTDQAELDLFKTGNVGGEEFVVIREIP